MKADHVILGVHVPDRVRKAMPDARKVKRKAIEGLDVKAMVFAQD